MGTLEEEYEALKKQCNIWEKKANKFEVNAATLEYRYKDSERHRKNAEEEVATLKQEVRVLKRGRRAINKKLDYTETQLKRTRKFKEDYKVKAIRRRKKMKMAVETLEHILDTHKGNPEALVRAMKRTLETTKQQ